MSADSRGPVRFISEVRRDPDNGRVTVTLKPCGHVVERVSHFSYRIGEPDRCFTCAKIDKHGAQLRALVEGR